MKYAFRSRLTAGLFLVAALFSLAPVARSQVLETRGPYQLQPGDQLDIRFRLTPEFNQSVAVQPDGYISLACAGEVKVADLDVNAAEAAVAHAASKRLNAPEVSISVTDFQKPYFIIAGEVFKPGRYDMRENTTALQALLIAGGPRATAKVTQILIYRRINGNHGEVRILNLKHIKKHADLERDCELQPGDMIYVERTKFASFADVMKVGNSLGLYMNPLSVVQ